VAEAKTPPEPIFTDAAKKNQTEPADAIGMRYTLSEGVSTMTQVQSSDAFVVELTAAQDRLFGFILKRTANQGQAKEILQEANMGLFRKALRHRC
jgi:hypothetical protein